MPAEIRVDEQEPLETKLERGFTKLSGKVVFELLVVIAALKERIVCQREIVEEHFVGILALQTIFLHREFHLPLVLQQLHKPHQRSEKRRPSMWRANGLQMALADVERIPDSKYVSEMRAARIRQKWK